MITEKKIRNKILLITLAILIGLNGILYYASDIRTLKKEVVIVEQELEEQDKFSKELQYIESLYDTLQMPDINKRYIQMILDDKIVDIMEKKPVSDSISESKFNREVAYALAKTNQLFQENEKLRQELIESEEYMEQRYRNIIIELAKKHQRKK